MHSFVGVWIVRIHRTRFELCLREKKKERKKVRKKNKKKEEEEKKKKKKKRNRKRRNSKFSRSIFSTVRRSNETFWQYYA